MQSAEHAHKSIVEPHLPIPDLKGLSHARDRGFALLYRFTDAVEVVTICLDIHCPVRY